MLDLLKTREEIDKIDKQIVKLFETRMELTQEVAAFKIKTGKKVFDKQREEEKLTTLSAMTDNPFNKKGIKELFSQIMSISRKRQYELLSDAQEEIDFSRVKEIETGRKKVACFGAKASYTEQAMEEYFGKDQEIESINCPTFKGVMEAIYEGKADYGVLPIENTSTGGLWISGATGHYTTSTLPPSDPCAKAVSAARTRYAFLPPPDSPAYSPL